MSYFLTCNKFESMNKLFLISITLLVLSACDKKYPIDNLPDDTTPPALTYPMASFSSTTKFIPFAGSLPSSGQCKGYDVFLTDTNQFVASASSGIVSSVTDDAAGNSSITVKYKANSIYSMVYSGIRSVMVQVNDSINAGTLLGKVGSNREIFFAVVKNNNEVLCPADYGSTGFNNAIQLAIDKHNANNPADSVLSSCLATSLPR